MTTTSILVERIHALETELQQLSARDLLKATGVSAGGLYRWMKDGAFPPQIRIGSLSL
jgi:predicted DNA-binding transcriptional regulator AlpA